MCPKEPYYRTETWRDCRGGVLRDDSGPTTHFEGFGVLGKFFRRRVTSFLTSPAISRSDPSKEDAIEEEDEDEEDEEDEDEEVKEENGVLVLNDANFDTFVADQDTVLLEFYAPW